MTRRNALRTALGSILFGVAGYRTPIQTAHTIVASDGLQTARIGKGQQFQTIQEWYDSIKRAM